MITKKPEWLVFLLSFLHKPREAGTPFSCSTYVAERMVRHIPEPDDTKRRNYLEIGPGTGVVTELLVKKLGANDTLHVVEIEEGFYNLIKQKFKEDRRVIVHHADISTWKADIQFDAIATGVPLNGLPNETVLKNILSAYQRLAKKGAEITAVEYVLTSTYGQWFKGAEFQKILKIKREFYTKYASEPAEIEWRNFPLPARVHRIKITEEKS